MAEVARVPSGLGLDIRLELVGDKCVATTDRRFEHLVQQARQSPDDASGVVLVKEYGAQRVELPVIPN